MVVCIYVLEYYMSMKLSKLLLHASLWGNLINLMLKERSETQKNTKLFMKFKNKPN